MPPKEMMVRLPAASTAMMVWAVRPPESATRWRASTPSRRKASLREPTVVVVAHLPHEPTRVAEAGKASRDVGGGASGQSLGRGFREHHLVRRRKVRHLYHQVDGARSEADHRAVGAGATRAGSGARSFGAVTTCVHLDSPQS